MTLGEAFHWFPPLLDLWLFRDPPDTLRCTMHAGQVLAADSRTAGLHGSGAALFLWGQMVLEKGWTDE